MKYENNLKKLCFVLIVDANSVVSSRVIKYLIVLAPPPFNCVYL
jgi:hypothetical protein